MSTAEIEREFRYDIIQKRRAGSGSFHKRGKGVKHGFNGALKTPYHYMTAKERKQLNGEVLVSNVYKSLMGLKELERYSEDMQKNIVNEWRKYHKNTEIYEALGITKDEYYDYLYLLGILDSPSRSDRGAKRGPRKPVATVEDLKGITLNDIKLIPDLEKRLATYDDITKKFNLESVAKLWGTNPKTLYSFRYGLNKKVEKLRNARKEETNVDENVNEHKQQVLKTENSPEKETIAMSEHNPELVQESQQNDVQEAQETIQEAVRERDEVTGYNKAELEELKQLVYAQSHLLAKVVESQKEQVQLAAVGGMVEEAPVKKNNAMTFLFEDEKEGFILHQDLSRFISVLQKNPDQFKVEIKLTRMED